MQATDPRLVQLAVVMAVEDSKMVNHCHTRPLIAGQGGGQLGHFSLGPTLTGAPSYKQHYMRLTILTSTFCRLNKKQLSIPFKFL